ncbi:hypothetical protein IPG41_01775 [Candidatus Peregrinibacteria bacterium]|nr:MAG: hypothetical protein IPG41_01775 [Candidatus Peregrinibacteria bacterium]
MDFHALALRASKNEVLAHYFGRKGGIEEWEAVFKRWPEEELHTCELILREIEDMEMDVEKKAARRHEVANTRMKQQFESVKMNLLQKVNSKKSQA